MVFDLSGSGLSQLVVSSILPLLSVLALIPWLVQFDKKKHLSAVPNSRSSHISTVSNIGGIGIFISVAIGLIPIFSLSAGKEMNMLFIGFILLFLLGIKDDIFDSSPYFKLAAQVLVGLIITEGAGLKIQNLYGVYEMPYTVSLIFSLLLIITIINSINFIDGIDGLASMVGVLGFSITGIIFYFLKEGFYFSLSIALVFSLIGFLRYNLSKSSKVFMGDTGSLLIGLAFSVFIIKIWGLSSSSNLFTIMPYWIFSVVLLPVFDFIRVFLIRVSNGKSPMRADRNHVHHILVDHCGFPHKKAALILSLFAFTVITVSLVLAFSESILLLLLWFFILFLVYISTLHQIQKMAFHLAALGQTEEMSIHKSLLNANISLLTSVYGARKKGDRLKEQKLAAGSKQ